MSSGTVSLANVRSGVQARFNGVQTVLANPATAGVNANNVYSIGNGIVLADCTFTAPDATFQNGTTGLQVKCVADVQVYGAGAYGGVGVVAITFPLTGAVGQTITVPIRGFWNQVLKPAGFNNSVLSTQPFCFVPGVNNTPVPKVASIVTLQSGTASAAQPPVFTPGVGPDLLITIQEPATAGQRSYADIPLPIIQA